MRPALRLALAFAATVASLVTAGAEAQEGTAEDPRDRARALAGDGDRAFSAGRCRRAIDYWREAEQLFPAPTIALRIARCRALLGEVIEATETLQQIVARTPRPDDPPAFAAAAVSAAEELDGIRARISALAVRIDSPSSAPAVAITVDERSVSGDAARFEVDPGRTRVRIHAGESELSEWVELDDGEQRTLDFRLRVVESPPIVSPLPTIGWVVAGSGAAALIAAGISGGLALDQAATLEERCGPERNLCTSEVAGEVAALERLSLTTDVLLGVGGLAASVGVVLVLVAPADETPEPRVFIEPTASGLALRGAF
jgi:hypothetical protein